MTTTGKIVGLILTSLLVAFIASKHAQAKVPGKCVPTHNLDQEMEKQFAEKPMFRGISVEGYYVMMYFNARSRTWTAFGVYPAQPHKACPLSAGGDGQIVIDKGSKL